MSGHPLHHHHPPSGQSYPYSTSPSTPGHPPGHLYHSSHRSSISASLPPPPPHTNGHSGPPHLSGPPPPNSSAARHGSAQVPPPPTQSAPGTQQAHHHSAPQGHPSSIHHHQSNSNHNHNNNTIPQQQPNPHPHHPPPGPAGSYHQSQLPHHPPSAHGHHINHSRDHPQHMKEYHHPHPSHPHSHSHSLSSSSQRDQRSDSIIHRERDHQPTRSHPHIHPSPSEPAGSLARDQQQLPRDPQSAQAAHPPALPHQPPPPNGHPNSSAHAAAVANHHHHHQHQHQHQHHHQHQHPLAPPPPGHHSPHSISMVSQQPNQSSSSSAHVGPPPPPPLHHHAGPAGNGTGGGPGTHTLPGPSAQQSALPPALPSNHPGGGATSRQLAQPPPQPAGANGGPPPDDATVASILRDGDLNLQKQIGDWRPSTNPLIENLVKATELTWVAAGSASETLGDYKRALECFERALKHNPLSVPALTKAAGIHRHQERFKAAANYFSRLLKIHEGSGEIWGALGHCYLMLDELPRAYTSYQQALHHFPTPKSEPKLWYGIGILYDRYGSLEHAEEAFSSVIMMDPHFEKANEIYFRLGIIYKQQRKAELSLECFQWILDKPPSPLTEIDIWFQIGHVHEQQGNFDQAKEAYERVLSENPTHAKVLQQLGGLYCREGSSFYNPQEAAHILTRSLSVDPGDPFSWYLLARVYMTIQDYTRAYESYQQAVYRDGKNPAFWCSIGVLYYAICQYHDSLDAYSRAIRINPYLSEVWFNLGALYESCNDQMPDAIDAYQRAIQLDSNNAHIQRRLEEIKLHQDTGAPLGPPPSPRDMNHSSPNWPFPNTLNASAEAGFGHSALAHEETAAKPPPVSHSPVATRPISPVVPSARVGLPRPGTASSASGLRPQSAGPFAHGPPPASMNIPPPHHPAHAGHGHPSAPQHGPPSASLNRRQSGGHGPLAPMEFESSPRLGTRGPPSAQHNLPHIRSVVDSQSRGPSPAPPAPESLRRPMSISGPGSAPREILSPRTSPSIRSNIPPGERAQYPSVPNGRPPAHHGPPPIYSRYPSSAMQVDETLPPQSQQQAPVAAAGSMGRDRDRERPMRDSIRLRPHSPEYRASPVERDNRGQPGSASSAMYPRDYPGSAYPPPPQQHHQAPYDPRHPSPGLRAGPGSHRFSPDQSTVPSPSWPGADHRGGPPPPGAAPLSPENRRPGSQAGYPAHYPPPNMPPNQMASAQHAPPGRRYDPRYDETTIPSHRQSVSHEQQASSSPRPRSAVQRPYNEDAERQKALTTVRQGQPSPTPSFTASEFSGPAAGAPRRTARTKLLNNSNNSNKEDDFPPTNHARRRKLPISRSGPTSANPTSTTVPPPANSAVVPATQPVMAPTPPVQAPTTTAAREGSQLTQKKEKKKVANTKFRATMKTKVTENPKRPSPSPAPPITNPPEAPSNRAGQPGSPPPPPAAPPAGNPSLPDRKVDEEFEEYDEVADALLSFAGQPPRRALASQPSPTVQSPHSGPPITSRSGPAIKTNVRRGNNGVSPGSEKSALVGGGGSPSNSPHSVAHRSTIESPNRAGSSPESTLVVGHPNNYSGGGRMHQSGILSDNGAGVSSSQHSAYPPGFSKRNRVEESSPTAGEASAPDPKRSRASVAAGQPSPRSQTHSDGRSPHSGGGSAGSKTSIMSLTGGKKGIMNDENENHGLASSSSGPTRRTKKSISSTVPPPSSTISVEEHPKPVPQHLDGPRRTDEKTQPLPADHDQQQQQPQESPPIDHQLKSRVEAEEGEVFSTNHDTEKEKENSNGIEEGEEQEDDDVDHHRPGPAADDDDGHDDVEDVEDGEDDDEDDQMDVS
ncbi:hypothetical protein MJO29_016183 [Puccinia striiformis f. sp. tritici]|nr:hypothetical protein MJO29_016183 [Puccinia striiformis f. sp. tritici]